MKKVVAIVCFLMSVVFVQAQKKVDTLQVKTNIYCSHFQICETGDATFKNNFIYNKGIKSYHVDDKSNIITVVYKPKKITPDEIRQAIANMGFDADDVKADEEAHNKLDACCRKE